MLFISIILIIAFILIIQLRSTAAPAPRPADNLKKGPCVDKRCWYWKVAADTYSFDFQPSFTLNRDHLWRSRTVLARQRHDKVRTGMDD